jgi:Na+-transporting NADH:ubiquinone oxidoreductase subunit C
MNKNSPVYVLGFMVVVCTVCGIAVSSVQFTMQKTLDSNAQLARNRTIASAFALTVNRQTAEAYDSVLALNIQRETITQDGRQWEIFVTLKKPSDIGFIFSGMGFWDMITGIIVLSADLSTIRSFEIIEQKETPGLGARIEEDAFKKQFVQYPVNWDTRAPKHIAFGDPVVNKDKRIDAITGATQTSMALERILNDELTSFKAVYEKQLAAKNETAGR